LNLYQVPNLADAYKNGNRNTWNVWDSSDQAYIPIVSFDFYEEIYHEDEYDSWWEDRCGYLEIDPALESKIINGVTGWVKKDGKTYYYDEDAKLVKGLKKIGTSTYYFDATTGERKTGWQTINKKKYYFDPNKYTMKTGWQTINTKKYYFDPKTGEMKTGWQTISKKKYYFDTTSGEMKTGWQTISKKKYYLDPKTGEMKTGLQTISKKKYYLDPKTGAMKTGLQTISKKSYFFDAKTGEMKTGWQTISKKKYFFKTNGVMAKNEYIKGFYVNKSGVRSNKAKCTWRKDKKGKKYGNAKGWFAKGVTLTIDGKKYTFKKNGYVK
jgi:glucan-binding repeat-containing protein